MPADDARWGTGTDPSTPAREPNHDRHHSRPQARPGCRTWVLALSAGLERACVVSVTERGSPAGAAHETRPYLPVAEHGLIGDLHSAALVATDGTIDWYCCPRFSSPSVFAAILDPARRGYSPIAP